MIKQLPISLQGARKGEARSQFAALCYRIRQGKLQFLLITSRKSKRWIVPKGWPMHAKTPEAAALQEAWEEAGVRGRVTGGCLGVYSYAKEMGDDTLLPVIAMLYPVEVKVKAKEYPEAGQRRRAWMSRKKAMKMVREPELRRMIRDFDPRPGLPDA
ncbi:NUDIX domain-containing protein [Sulfitobacter marinus]|uniref:NUDIX domain-containing protein n=1 Tax=Sulfitobacter marinus TaxID=394264 RepID=A0A1I6RRH1_9RHOB|nr:NUDIX hydrolase [Sulfitobacter marinus]SFS67343.1 NUDIX domain-containing protein [Sulfitobacter marinus]